MSQDFLYTIVPRVALGPDSLVFNRRVRETTVANRSHKTASKEHRHEKESTLNNDFESDFVEEKKTLGSSIDDVV